jgi:hypothetical protein
MRYAEIEDGRPGSRHYPNGGLELPILYSLDGDRILKSRDTPFRTVKRIHNGAEMQIPNWASNWPTEKLRVRRQWTDN